MDKMNLELLPNNQKGQIKLWKDIDLFLESLDEEDLSDPRMAVIVKEVKKPDFVHVIDQISGWTHGEHADDWKTIQEKRDWVATNLSSKQQELLLNIVVNGSMMHYVEGSVRHGHTHLYREFVGNADSFFRPSMGRDVQVRLNNGRFWENIGTSGNDGAEVVSDVLTNHFDHLDYKLARWGMDIAFRNASPPGTKKVPNIDLARLPNPALDAYEKFIEILHKNRRAAKLTSYDMQILVAPYAEEVVSRIHDPSLIITGGYDGLRFGEFLADMNATRSIHERFSRPTLKHYFRTSTYVQESVAAGINEAAEFLDHPEEIEEIFQALPRGADLVRPYLKLDKELEIALI